MNTRQKGRDGESLAVRYLEGCGYRLLTRNYLSPSGEVDVIAVKDEVLVFMEVKSWNSIGPEGLERSVSREKQRRIVMTSRYYLMDHPEFEDFRVRYDIAFIEPRKSKVHHIPSAFTETDAA